MRYSLRCLLRWCRMEPMTQTISLPTPELVEEYASGKSLTALARTHGVPRSTLTRHLTQSGVTLRTHSENNRIHHFNEHYFDTIDTPDKAYWLGFIFADGSVGSSRFDTKISLAIKDLEHLEKFAQCLDYSGPGAVRTGITNGQTRKPTEYATINLRSETLWRGLVDKGCVPNKTMTCTSPFNVPAEFNRDFIRGVVDGDGYVSIDRCPAVEIVGARPILSWIARPLGMSEPKEHKSIWRIRSAGNHALDVMEALYYPEHTMSLTRKNERVRANLARGRTNRATKGVVNV